MSTRDKLCVYVDVDDTLVRSIGSKRIPIPNVIEHVRQLHKQGASLYCWSAGGADYARESAAELQLQDCFIAFLPKPKVMIDDQFVDCWPEFIHVYPGGCKSLDDYEVALKRS